MDPNAQTTTVPVENETQPVQQPSEPSPPENKPRITKKRIFIILGAIIIVILLISSLAGAYLYSNSSQAPARENESKKTSASTPTPDPTTDWETYTGKYYSFKYPKTWKFSTRDEPAGTTSVDGRGEFYLGPIDIDKTYIQFQVFPSEDTSLKLLEDSIKESVWVNNISYIKIDNVDATRASGQLYGAEEIRLVFENGNYVYRLSKFSGSSVIFDQILSTFKFTDSESSVDTSDWKTFTHPELNFEIKYPNTWVITTQDIPDTSTTKRYKVFYARTNDYDADYILNSGAEFLVSAKSTNETSIDNIFNNSLGAEIANNKSNLNLNELNAIQYDFSYEGTIATITEFIYDGVHYVIKYRYVNNNEKNKFWNDYQQLLNSFKFAE